MRSGARRVAEFGMLPAVVWVFILPHGRVARRATFSDSLVCFFSRLGIRCEPMLKFASHFLGRFGASRLLIRLVASYFILVQLYKFLSASFGAHFHGPKGASQLRLRSSEDGSCGDAEALSDNLLVIMVKTGASEATEKVPVQLENSLRCWPFANTIWFSDMPQQIQGHRLLDALDAIPEAIQRGNSDFEIYRRQQEGSRGLQNAMDRPDGSDDPNFNQRQAAWNLDKYKFIHLVEKSWKLKPEADWYLIVDADTYVVLPSLLTWLPRLDSARRLLLGSMACYEGRPFGHGGSGILMSRAAVYDLVVANPGTAARWDARIHENCCGDSVLADAFRDYGVNVGNAWPVLNGETPFTIRFKKWNWCQPLVTMHHIDRDAAEQLASFEKRRRDPQAPLRYYELFTDFISDLIPDDRENWDNKSNGVTVPDMTSAPDCLRACEENAACLQSLWNGSECWLGTEKIVLGEPHEPEQGGNMWHSSWNKTRIASWVAEQGRCGKVEFPFEDGQTSISSENRCL
ncbi:hypothetical protein PZA11_006475 [Diplocarpon coronariae]